jgi:hypothetical protein
MAFNVPVFAHDDEKEAAGPGLVATNGDMEVATASGLVR